MEGEETMSTRLPPQDENLQAFHRILDAVSEFQSTLKTRRVLSLAEVNSIAKKHGVNGGSLLSQADLDPDCRVDYAKGEVRCS